MNYNTEQIQDIEKIVTGKPETKEETLARECRRLRGGIGKIRHKPTNFTPKKKKRKK